MPAGRPPKPLVLLEMSGSTKRNPGRYKDRMENQLETKGPIGGPPESFVNSSQRIRLTALWEKITSEAPVGLLTASDREFVEQLCRFGVDAKGCTKTSIRSGQLYVAGLKSLGMTPEGRARSGIGGKASSDAKAPNKLDSFLAKGKRKTG
jgi:hypothetical protein